MTMTYSATANDRMIEDVLKLGDDLNIFYVFHVNADYYVYGVVSDLRAELERCERHFASYEITIKNLLASSDMLFMTAVHELFGAIVDIRGERVSQKTNVLRTTDLESYNRVLLRIRNNVLDHRDELAQAATTLNEYVLKYAPKLASPIL